MADINQPGPGSRIIRERAMKVLRETRAKIDPALLAAMKERLSGVAGGSGGIPAASAVTPNVAEPVYPTQKFEAAPQLETEPVDRQKIAQIVLHYMKTREDSQKH